MQTLTYVYSGQPRILKMSGTSMDHNRWCPANISRCMLDGTAKIVSQVTGHVDEYGVVCSLVLTT